MKAYSNIEIAIGIESIDLNANFNASVYSISSSNSINFNRIHNNPKCVESFKGLLKGNFKGKPTSQEIKCSVCDKAVAYSDLASCYILNDEIAIFSKEELALIKSASEGVQLTKLIDNSSIKEFQKGKVYGLGLHNKKNKKIDEQLYVSLLSFLSDNSYSLLGYYGNRGSQHICRIFSETISSVPALFLQVLAEQEAVDTTLLFMQEAVVPFSNSLIDLKEQTHSLEVLANQKMVGFNPFEMPIHYKEEIEKAIAHKIETGEVAIVKPTKKEMLAVANPFVR